MLECYGIQQQAVMSCFLWGYPFLLQASFGNRTKSYWWQNRETLKNIPDDIGIILYAKNSYDKSLLNSAKLSNGLSGRILRKY